MPPNAANATIFVARCAGQRYAGRVALISIEMLIRSLAHELGSQAEVARIIGVNPSRVSRWLKGERPDADSLRQLEGIEFAMRRLLHVFERGTAIKWLHGSNAHLRHARPIDLLMMGRVTEVIDAIDASDAGSYA